MKRSIVLFWVVLSCNLLAANDFYLPLVGYSKLDKTTKKTTERKVAGVCCLIGSDMFVFIDGQKIDCTSSAPIEYRDLSNNTAQMMVKSDVSFNCANAVEMTVILNFVNKALTNIYLLGNGFDYEFYLGDI